MKKCWNKTKGKNIWKNDKEGRWVGIQKIKSSKNYRFYTIKDGYITHGDFDSKKEAMSRVKNWINKC